jgi:excisionase family DNA binding protein
MQPQPPRLYTVAEAAQRLRVDPEAVRRRIRRRQLLATKPTGAKSWLVPESELKRVINGGINQ